MKFDHSFKHHDVSQALMQYAEERMAKLSRYEIKPGTAHITYSSQRHRCLVEIDLMGGERNLHAHVAGNDWYGTVDLAIQKLEVQMRKRKSIVKGHRHPERSKQGKMSLLNAELETDYSRMERGSARKTG